VRAIGTGDLDGDGRAELLFGDGWHKRYGELARFRPSIARSGPEGWATELVEERSDQYAVEQIGSQGARLIAGGNQNVRVYEQGPEGWTLISGPHASSLTGAWTVMDGRMLVLGGRTLRRVELP